MVLLSIVLPVFNEEKILAENFQKIHSFLKGNIPAYEIILGNDGSTDNSLSIIKELKEKYENVKYVTQDINTYRGFILTKAMRIAGGDYIGYLDIDLEIDFLYIKDFLKLLENDNYDVVIASKYIERDTLKDLKKFRYFLHLVHYCTVKTLLNSDIRDNQGGLKIFKKAAIKSILDEIILTDWMWDTEVLTRLQNKGYRIKEFPVKLNAIDRRSKIKFLKASIKSFISILYLFSKGIRVKS
ncbi:MAG: glycosyltransferase [Candidatus Hydrogenedentota bacterium]